MKLKTNCANGVTTNGEVVVVPTVLIVTGVLNGALLTPDEYGKHVGGWNGRPVVVRHPIDGEGVAVSAADSPDVWERYTVGRLFNARVEDGRLLADLHVDLDALCALGMCALAERIKRNEVIEVSTGYFSDDDFTPGEFEGVPYTVVHRNIVPDHLALLPDETGACSVEDGCGTFRTNRNKTLGKNSMKFNKAKAKAALAALAKAPKVNSKSSKEDVVAVATVLKTHELLTTEQLEIIQAMDPKQMEFAVAFIEAARKAAETEAGTEVTTDPEEDKEDPEGPLPNTQEDDEEKPKDVQGMVNNAVAAAIQKDRIVQRLVTNSACAFTEGELNAKSIASLMDIEKQLSKVVVANAEAAAVDMGALGGMAGFNVNADKDTIVANAATAPIPPHLRPRTTSGK